MNAMERITASVGRVVEVEVFFHQLIYSGWKYDAEESDLFHLLSRTFRAEGIKVSAVLPQFCCVPPCGEMTTLEAVRFFSFDPSNYPERDVRSLFEKDRKEMLASGWENADAYIAHLERNYPYHIPHADHNTAMGLEDESKLKPITLAEVPALVLEEVADDLKKGFLDMD
jgi:hypothetical protein